MHTARPGRAGKKEESAAQEGFGASGPRAHPHCAIQSAVWSSSETRERPGVADVGTLLWTSDRFTPKAPGWRQSGGGMEQARSHDVSRRR